MSVKEMKETLVQRIQESEDEQYIGSLLQYSDEIRDERREPVFKLTDGMRASIRRGQEQIARGEFFTHEEVMREWDEWNDAAEKKWGDK